MIFLLAITMGIGAIFAFDLTPWVRGGYGWRWEYEPLAAGSVAIFLFLVLVYISGAYVIHRRTQRASYTFAWSIFGSIVLSLAVAALREGDAMYALITRTISVVSSGEHWMAVSINWADGSWHNWTGLMAELGSFTSNAATIPAGVPILYHLTSDVFDKLPAVSQTLTGALLPYQCDNFNFLSYTQAQWSSVWLGILMPVWASLSVFPIYSISKRIAPKTDPRLPVLMWAIMPNIVAFSGSTSTLFPLFSLLAFWGLMHSVFAKGTPGRYQWALVGGLFYGVGSFLNMVFFPITPLYVLFLLSVYFSRRTQARIGSLSILSGVAFVIGALVPWTIWLLLSGQTPLDTLIQALHYHFTLDRPYWFWVWNHTWDWIVWSGLPLFLLLCYGLFRWLHRRKQQPGDTPPILGVSLLLMVLIWAFSGTSRGESGRVWLTLTPFLLIAVAEIIPSVFQQHERSEATSPGASLYTRLVRHTNSQPWISLFVAQSIMFVILIATLSVFYAPDLQYPPDSSFVPVSNRADALFVGSTGPLFRLVGYDSSVANDEITLTLNWQGVSRPLQYQWFSALLVSPSGNVFPLDVWQPSTTAGQRFPTTCWGQGEEFSVITTLPLPENAEPGNWYISLSAFGDPELPEGRLQVQQLDGSIDTQTGIGPVMVPPASQGS